MEKPKPRQSREAGRRLVKGVEAGKQLAKHQYVCDEGEEARLLGRDPDLRQWYLGLR